MSVQSMDLNSLKHLIDGKKVVYDYLRQQKKYYLDNFHHRSMTKTYLDGLLRENFSHQHNL